ncbi:MAG: restriction endonuclease subunit S [Schaalia hyovaginalis]|uniref:restriction endonuclease subunit S n=1 Tax=Schaalia hyovaginalis TaxID=29316 RepID=UPI002A9132A3|nr:restriction endonuclease subunit S [Schaalia hyovaginalis]MDY6214050.1 restriction endonuclease subunit S [Schaalia hyovaginalis]
MNRIERMVAEMCPDGVECQELGDLCHFQRGRWIKANQLIPGTVPVVTSAQEVTLHNSEANRFGENVVISSSGAYAGFVSYWDRPIYLSNAFTVHPNEGVQMLVRFLYFLLKSQQEKIYGMASAAGVPNVYGADIARLSVQVPPIEIQREIVDILDSFTKLEAELEAELEARRQQFRLVADRFIELAAGEQARIADHVDFIRGVTYSKSDEVSAGYGREILRASNIDGLSRRIVFDDLRTVSSGVKFKDQQLLHLDDVLMVGSSGSLVHLGKSALVREDDLKSGPMLFGAFMMVLRVRDTLDARFLFHLLGSSRFQEFTSSDSSSATINNLNPTKIGRFVFSLPPLEVQRRIADVLDDFDELVNDLSSGLPAEIAARRQQYEYYRDRLLTFPEKK